MNEEIYKVIVKLFTKSMYYGDWERETPNEMVIQFLMEKVGLWPFENEDEMIK